MSFDEIWLAYDSCLAKSAIEPTVILVTKERKKWLDDQNTVLSGMLNYSFQGLFVITDAKDAKPGDRILSIP